jgi:hypothetical protein
MDKKTTAMPVIAGIFLLASAGLKLFGFFVLLVASFLAIMPSTFPRLGAFAVIFLLVLALIVIAVEIAGGIASLQRKRWGLALAGSILSVFPFSLLGIASIVLVVLSKNEFQ